MGAFWAVAAGVTTLAASLADEFLAAQRAQIDAQTKFLFAPFIRRRDSGITNFHESEPSKLLPLVMFDGMKVGYRFSDDGDLAYRYAICSPPQHLDNGKAVLFLQGKSGFIELYAPLLKLFVEMGYTAYMEDLVSQGLSARLAPDMQMIHVPCFDAYYLKQAQEFYERFVESRHKDDLIIVASSTGAHLALRGLIAGAFKASRLVACAPMVMPKSLPMKESWNGYARFLLAWGGGFVPVGKDMYFPWNLSLKDNGPDRDARILLDPATRDAFLENNKYSRNHQRLVEVAEVLEGVEPRLISGGVSRPWVLAKYRSEEILWAGRGSIAPEIRVALAETDRMVCNHATIRFLRSVPEYGVRSRDGTIIVERVPDLHAFPEFGTLDLLRRLAGFATLPKEEIGDGQPFFDGVQTHQPYRRAENGCAPR